MTLSSVVTISRQRIDPDRETRLRHIQVAYQVLSRRLSVRQIALIYGISRRTAYYWRDLAKTYPDPEADVIRRMAADDGRN